MGPEDEGEENRARRRQYIVAIVIWCLAGWANATFTWHVLWLPGLLILVPGIFVACVIAAIFSVPLSRIMKKIRADWDAGEEKKWNLLAAAMALRVFLYLGPLIGSVLYVHFIRIIME